MIIMVGSRLTTILIRVMMLLLIAIMTLLPAG